MLSHHTHTYVRARADSTAAQPSALWQEGVITHLPVLCSAQKHFTMMWSNPPSLETIKYQTSADLHTKSSLSSVCMPYGVIRPWRSESSHITSSSGFHNDTKRKKNHHVLSKVQPCFKNTTLYVNVIYNKINQAIRYKGMIIVLNIFPGPAQIPKNFFKPSTNFKNASKLKVVHSTTDRVFLWSENNKRF